MGAKSRAALLVVLWASLLGGLGTWLMGTQSPRISIAAGPRSGESFELITRIAPVLEAAMPGTLIDVFETQGSGENLRLLRSGRVDLATLQADIEVSEGIESVATLFFDAFQFVATIESGIEHVYFGSVQIKNCPVAFNIEFALQHIPGVIDNILLGRGRGVAATSATSTAGSQDT